jgi:TP901 family phage tail tape measure protein
MQFNVHVPRGLNEVKNKTAIARQELQVMNKVIQDGAGQLINWGKNTQWAGRQLTVGLTVPLAAFGKAAADAFRQADEELVRLTKVYGDVAGTSAAELSKVRAEVSATAKELSAAMGVNFKETIGLAADIAATGKQGDELLGSIKETTRLAVLGEVDRQEAMKATLAIQSAFKQNTEELSQSINFLNAVENQTSTTLNDLVEAIPKAGPVIQGLGGSVQDLALYLTAMREGGINASEGANALKSALASLINPTDVAVGKFKTLGIDLLGIVNNNAGDLTGTLMALQSALDNLNPLQKQQAIEQLFGKFQFSRLNALFENLGRQGSQTLQVLDLMKASTDDLAAVAGRELSAVTESASGKYRRALESLKASLAEVGDQFLTINTTLITVIDKVIQFAANLPKPVKQVLALLGGITAVIGPFIMLTGVLANFFGYVVKGIAHMKAFFKGGEGWKYLTPEMLAAEKAGKLVEQSFYSDAKAAAVLQQALRNLIDEFAVLETKAKTGAISVAPAVSTMAGNLLMAGGGGRVVDPSHPLVGQMGTRASSHMVPRAGMTEEQRLAQTIFGMVPGSGPVNQKIGQNPQIYMNDQLPNVEGLTRVNGVSTGVVSGEAARWHAMMGTLAMQSKSEIETLKQQIVATGTVSKDFMMQFDDILPAVSKITTNAATESGLIVAELRAGNINLEAARAKIIALNLETERMIASSVQAQAAGMGRSINPTMVPTLNQPVVDATGRSNMRELFKKGKTKDFINKVAGALGVRTSGAGYNIETTKPKRMSMGGPVYLNSGTNRYAPTMTRQVNSLEAQRRAAMDHPGEPLGTDKVPAWLTEGEYVVRASAVTPQTLPFLEALNGGGPEHLSAQMLWQSTALNQGLEGRGVNGNAPMALTGRNIASDYRGLRSSGLPPAALLYDTGKRLGYDSNKLRFHLNNYEKALSQKLASYGNRVLSKAELELLQENLLKRHAAQLFRIDPTTGGKINFFQETALMGSRRVGGKGGTGFIGNIMRALLGTSSGFSGGQNEAHLMTAQELLDSPQYSMSGDTMTHLPSGSSSNPRASKMTLGKMFGVQKGHLGSKMWGSVASIGARLAQLRSGRALRMSTGGMVPKAGYYAAGSSGPIQAIREGYVDRRAMAGQVTQGSPTGGMGSFMGGMALQMGGNMVGGTTGEIMSMAGMGMQMLPMLGMLKGLVGGVTKLSGGFRMLGSVGGTAINILSKLRMINPYVLGGTVVLGGLIAAFKKWRKEIEETKREQTNMFGITEKGAKEAGIKYVSLTEKVKALREEQKLAADKAKAYFESYTSSGVKGLTLTIQQLKELKQRVKTDMPDLLSTFNSIDTSKVNDLASNLKAQMISSGKTVEEATNLIYALIEASNKAGQGVSAISSKAFAGITNQGAAADFVIKNLAKNIDDLANIDASAFASNVDSAIASLDAAVNSLVGTKDESGKVIDEAAAIAIQFERIADSGAKNKKIGADTLATLKAQRPEFAAILNKADTIGGMYAKWRLMLQGVYIDLAKLSSAQAETLATFTAGLDAASADALAEKGRVDGLTDARAVLKELRDDYAKAEKASNASSIASSGLSKKQIKTIQDRIKLIREEADARKKALRENFDRENADLELQQAKLELQSAIARGDKDAASAAQLRIQQIQKETSLKLAEAAIDNAAKKAEDKQQAILDKDQAYKDRLAEGAANAGNRANNLGQTIKTVNELGAELGRVAKLRVLSESPKATAKDKEEFRIAFSNVLNDIAKAANSSPEVAKAYGQFLTKNSEGKYIPLGMNEAKTVSFKRSGSTVNMPEGAALSQLDQLSGSMTNFALDITGGKKLKDIYEILATGKPAASTISFNKDEAGMKAAIAKNAGKSSAQYLNPYDGEGFLTMEARKSIVMAKKLVAGDSFTDSNGNTYNVKNGYDAKIKPGYSVKRALGGRIVPGQAYTINDGMKIEGIRFDTPGMVYPNANTMPRFNIPGDGQYGMAKGTNNSFNNNTYNIDIDLNGTNVSVDDIMNRFKAELALIGAKQGRSRALGGMY